MHIKASSINFLSVNKVARVEGLCLKNTATVATVAINLRAAKGGTLQRLGQ